MKQLDDGFVGIGIFNVKRTHNFGALIRAARVFGASFVFSVGSRNPQEHSSIGIERVLPIFHFDSVEQFISSIPVNARLVCVELTPGAQDIRPFVHPGSRQKQQDCRRRGHFRWSADWSHPQW